MGKKVTWTFAAGSETSWNICRRERKVVELSLWIRNTRTQPDTDRDNQWWLIVGIVYHSHMKQ